MANANFIVQNGLNVGGTTGAVISFDTATGSIVMSPAPTAANANPVAVVISQAGTISSVQTTAGVANSSDIGASANTASATSLTTFANVAITGNITANGTGYLKVPAGTNAQRPSNAFNGMMRYNSDITSFEGYYAGAWSSLGGVKSVDGKAYIIAERSAGSADDVVRVYSGDSGTSTQTAWFSTSNVSILPTTAATSTTTGALQVAGGAGIAGALYVGGNFVVTGNMTVNGTTTTINNTTVETTEYVQTIDATTVRSVTIGNSGAVLYGTLNSASASQTNITAVGTLTGLTTGTILPSANVTQNLGSTSAYWNNIYGITFVGTSTTAKYADLAENYQADKPYMPSTVVMFGGSAEVTVADADTTAIAGVVSTNPAHLMNGGLNGTNVVPVALQGRVPCQVIGPVRKGDLMVSAGHGFAKVNNTPAVGTVIGKALQEVTFAGKAVIEVVVGRV